jgi:hypothetical protein
MAVGKGVAPFRVFGGVLAALVLAPSVASAHALLVKPVPRDITDTKLKMGPCGGSAATGPLTKKAPVEQYQPGATITVDFKETVNHTGCYLFRLSPTGDNGPWQVLKQVEDTGAIGGNLTTQLTLPAGVTCQNCTLQFIQVMNGGCVANQDPTATPNYYSCADVRIGNFADAGAIVDAGMPDYDASSQDEPDGVEPDSDPVGGPVEGGTVNGGGGEGNSADPRSRNLQAGKGDDCSVGVGSTTGMSLFAIGGLAVFALLRRRKTS